MSIKRTLLSSVKDALARDPFMEKCCIADATCRGRIEWHHNLIYAGKRSDEAFTILPVCGSHHAREKNVEIGELLDCVMFKRASLETLQVHFPKRNWKTYYSYLNSKYGITTT